MNANRKVLGSLSIWDRRNLRKHPAQFFEKWNARMRVAIIGAGAIGGFIAARLTLSGQPISVVDQGSQIEAIRRSGIRLIESDGSETPVRPMRAVASASELEPQDIVLLGVKAHQIGAVAPSVRKVIHTDTTVVTLQNGIPWWYFHKSGNQFEGHSFSRLDPDGFAGKFLPTESLIACVAYPACTTIGPGVIRHEEGNRFPIGELDGQLSPRLERVSAMFQQAGFKAPMLTDIRSEIWLKLWGNLSFNPISALTHTTMAEIAQSPASRKLAEAMMREAEEIATCLGIKFRVTLEHRIAGAESMGAHKTSMLQDVEAGRSLEIEALLGALIELGALTQTPTPAIDAVYACTVLLGQSLSRHAGGLCFKKHNDDVNTSPKNLPEFSKS